MMLERFQRDDSRSANSGSRRIECSGDTPAAAVRGVGSLVAAPL